MKKFILVSIVALILLGSCAPAPEVVKVDPKIVEVQQFKSTFVPAWERSKAYTIKLAEAMPSDDFQYRLLDSVFTFSEQFTHSIQFAGGQMAAHVTPGNNPFQGKDWDAMSKEDVLGELEGMYDTVGKVLIDTPEDSLTVMITFAGQELPRWRMFQIIENHTIHHRGQAIMYLREKGIQPPGYPGW